MTTPHAQIPEDSNSIRIALMTHADDTSSVMAAAVFLLLASNVDLMKAAQAGLIDFMERPSGRHAVVPSWVDLESYVHRNTVPPHTAARDLISIARSILNGLFPHKQVARLSPAGAWVFGEAMLVAAGCRRWLEVTTTPEAPDWLAKPLAKEKPDA